MNRWRWSDIRAACFPQYLITDGVDRDFVGGARSDRVSFPRGELPQAVAPNCRSVPRAREDELTVRRRACVRTRDEEARVRLSRPIPHNLIVNVEGIVL